MRGTYSMIISLALMTPLLYWSNYILMVLAGIAVGLVSSFFGVGACFIMVPVMISFFEKVMGTPAAIAPLIAFGTNMAVVVPTSISGLLRHVRELRKKELKFPLKHYIHFVIPVAIGSLTGSLLAYTVFKAFRMKTGIFLKGGFGAVCLIGAYRFMRAKPLPIKKLNSPSAARYGIMGLISGIAANFIGIGGGIVYMPVLNTVLKIPVHLSTIISIATMILGSSVGSLSFVALGRMDQVLHPLDYPPYSFGWFNLLAFLLIGVPSVLAAQIGPRIAHKTSPKRYKILLAAVYFYIGLRLIIRAFYQAQGLKPPIP